MRYLVFSPYSTDCTNSSTLLDYSVRVVTDSANTEILFVYLDSFLTQMNDMNIHGGKWRSNELKFDNWLTNKSFVSPQISYLPLSKYVDSKIKKTFEFNNLEDIKRIEYKNVNIGYGVVASYVSFFRNINPVFDEIVRSFFNDYLISTSLIVEGLLNICNKYKIDRIVTFNGRFAALRAAIEVAKNIGIAYTALEHVSLNKYDKIKCVEFNNCMPQSIANVKTVCDDIWSRMNNEDIKVAKSFFERRSKGIVAGDKVYIDKQIAGKLPEDWDVSKNNIVFFSSSEDEFYSIDEEWEKLKLFANQEEAVNEISKMCIDSPNIHIYLRIHPHLIGLPYSYAKFLSAYNLQNVTVIPAESPISTYDLIKECNICITMGSTTGVEATYWGKPSILVGGSLYYNLNAVYCPHSKEELKTLLISEKLSAKPQENALKFGAFISGLHRGKEPFRIDYKPVQIKFKGKHLDIPANLKIWNSRIIYELTKVIFRVLDYRAKRNFNNEICTKLKVEDYGRK